MMRNDKDDKPQENGQCRECITYILLPLNTLLSWSSPLAGLVEFRRRRGRKGGKAGDLRQLSILGVRAKGQWCCTRLGGRRNAFGGDGRDFEFLGGGIVLAVIMEVHLVVVAVVGCGCGGRFDDCSCGNDVMETAVKSIRRF